MTKEDHYEIYFPPNLVAALTKIHEEFNIDITEYIIKSVEDDLRCSKDPTSDSVLNTIIRENREGVIALLEVMS